MPSYRNSDYDLIYLAVDPRLGPGPWPQWGLPARAWDQARLVLRFVRPVGWETRPIFRRPSRHHSPQVAQMSHGHDPVQDRPCLYSRSSSYPLVAERFVHVLIILHTIKWYRTRASTSKNCNPPL